MHNYIKKVLLLLTSEDKKRGLMLLILTIFLALVEMAGVGSIAPFLYVLGNPEVIETNKILSSISASLNLANREEFLLILGIFSFIFLLFAAAYRGIVYYLTTRFANMQRHSIGSRLLSQYLRQPYEYFLKTNSTELSKKILSETDHIISQAIIPTLNAVTNGLVIIAIVGLLIYLNPLLAIVTAVFFGGFYVALYWSVRKYLYRIGSDVKLSNTQRFQIASETLKGVKELKVLGRESAYLDAFDNPSKRYSRHMAIQSTILRTPEFLVEVLAFGAILLIAIYVLDQDAANLGNVIPILGLYGFGAVKLKPCMQVMFSSYSQFRFVDAILDAVIEDLKPIGKQNEKDNSKLKLSESIEINDIEFSYPNKEKPAICKTSISIPTKSSLGIIGSTGSGKSTFVDILLGLLEPQAGEILIDGKALDKSNYRSWLNTVGYVPQHIFLADDSIIRNIAFGIDDNELDLQAATKAAQIAQIHDFIQTLPGGYDSKIGEQGVRLSGGERQRIGIARALYHNPELLILDEATSALDNDTEAKLMEELNRSCKDKTVIMIAHRLSTIENCDQIIELKAGNVHQVNKESVQ